MSPVWIINAGFCGNALTLVIASSSVPSALGLAGLSKPTWLSLICRKVRPRLSAACASSMIPSECGTPPAMVHSTPVPHQVMHSRTLRRLMPSRRSISLICESPFEPPSRHFLCGLQGRDRTKASFIPGSAKKIVHSLHGLKLAIHFGGTLLKLAFHFGGALTDIHRLAHCNKRGWARADAGRADNGDNLRWRDVNRGALWPDERNEKTEHHWENRRHIIQPPSVRDRLIRASRAILDKNGADRRSSKIHKRELEILALIRRMQPPPGPRRIRPRTSMLSPCCRSVSSQVISQIHVDELLLECA